MAGAFRAADAIDRALERRKVQRSAFRDYERWVEQAVGTYRAFVKGWYTPEFAEVMMHPTDKFQLRQAVTSLLAGCGVGSFPVTWRIWLFRAVTRLNRHLLLTPRLPGRREATLA
jgi:hypothetical protein